MIRIPFFRIFYSTTFSILLLLAIGLLAVSPADGIYQSYRNGHGWSIVIIAGVYFLVCSIALFLYATRLYTTRITLAAIPKTKAPLDKGDLPTSVRRMVLSGIERSASIAFRVKPRNLTEEIHAKNSDARLREKAQRVVPTWGDLSHAGWAAPHDQELPDMHYTPVLQELPYLLEARAVSLAPLASGIGIDAQGDAIEDSREQQTPDLTYSGLLQRPSSLPFRSYIGRLADLGVIGDIDIANGFLTRYEHARFSGSIMTDDEFCGIMEFFAQVLDSMQEPNTNSLHALAVESETSSLKGLYDIDTQQHTDQVQQSRAIDGKIRATQNPRFKVTNQDLNSSTGSLSLSGHSHKSANSDGAFVTPALHPSAFLNPHTDARSAKTTSTGSLAGSEGTARTAPNRVARWGASGRRALSAFSRRSSRRMVSSKTRTSPPPDNYDSKNATNHDRAQDGSENHASVDSATSSQGSVRVTRQKTVGAEPEFPNEARESESSTGETGSVRRRQISEVPQ